jgi:hypothetical protein
MVRPRCGICYVCMYVYVPWREARWPEVLRLARGLGTYQDPNLNQGKVVPDDMSHLDLVHLCKKAAEHICCILQVSTMRRASARRITAVIPYYGKLPRQTGSSNFPSDDDDWARHRKLSQTQLCALAAAEIV